MWYFKRHPGQLLTALKLLLLVGASLASQCGMAENIAVIANINNSTNIDENLIKHLYLGTTRSFSDSATAIPINLSLDSPHRKNFEKIFLKRSRAYLKANWSRMLFTGKGTPPVELSDPEKVIALVKGHTKYIGYVPQKIVDPAVKVILLIDIENSSEAQNGYP